jgi:hypothetical protein
MVEDHDRSVTTIHWISGRGECCRGVRGICRDAVEYEIDTSRRLPHKAEMRAGILWKIGVVEEANPEEAPSSFQK